MFPAVEIEGQDIIQFTDDVDHIVAHLAKMFNVDVSTLYVYNHYIEGVFPRYKAMLGATIKAAGGWPQAFPSVGVYRILVLGASGMVGSRISKEAKLRGHFVTGASRKGDVQVDANSSESLVKAIKKVDCQVLVVAMGPSRTDPDAPKLVETYKSIIAAARETNVKVFFVGGAGTLLAREGGPLQMEVPEFPDFVKPEAQAHLDALEYLRTVDDVVWTSLAPAPMIQPGERTGAYKLGSEVIIGFTISAEDYAVAALDEIANPKNEKKRFACAAK